MSSTDRIWRQFAERCRPLDKRARPYAARVTHVLKSSGYRVTSQRFWLMKVLGESRFGLTPAEVFDRISSEGGSVDRVTVYRTLALFLDLGIACKLSANGRIVGCQEPSGSMRQTFHVLLEESGEMVELPMPKAISEAVDRQAGLHGFIPTSIRVEVSAISQHKPE